MQQHTNQREPSPVPRTAGDVNNANTSDEILRKALAVLASRQSINEFRTGAA